LIAKFYPFIWPTFFQVKFLDHLGTGIWIGTFLILTSAIGIVAGTKQNYNRFGRLPVLMKQKHSRFLTQHSSILTFFVASVFSALMSVPCLCISIIGALISPFGTDHC